MIKSEEKEIDGLTIRVQQLPGMRSVKLWARLVRMAGPSLIKAAGEFKGGLKGLNVAALGDAAQLLLDKCSPEEFEALIKELFESATVKGDDGQTMKMMAVFDIVFAGRIGVVLKALKFALEVNYGDFFGGLLANAGSLETFKSQASISIPGHANG